MLSFLLQPALFGNSEGVFRATIDSGAFSTLARDKRREIAEAIDLRRPIHQPAQTIGPPWQLRREQKRFSLWGPTMKPLLLCARRSLIYYPPCIYLYRWLVRNRVCGLTHSARSPDIALSLTPKGCWSKDNYFFGGNNLTKVFKITEFILGWSTQRQYGTAKYTITFCLFLIFVVIVRNTRFVIKRYIL